MERMREGQKAMSRAVGHVWRLKSEKSEENRYSTGSWKTKRRVSERKDGESSRVWSYI